MFLFHSKKTWCRPPGEWGSLYSGLDVSNCIVGRKSTVNDDINGDGDDDGWKVMIQGRFEGDICRKDSNLRANSGLQLLSVAPGGVPVAAYFPIPSNTTPYYQYQYYPNLSNHHTLSCTKLLSSIHCPCIHPHYKMERFWLSFHIRLGCMVGTKVYYPFVRKTLSYLFWWVDTGYMQANWISGTDTWPAEALTNQTHWRPPR